MNESLGINVITHTEECCELPITCNLMHLFTGDQQVYSCMSCYESEEAKSDDMAWNLHEDDRLGEGHCLSIDTSDAPSASEWVASTTYIEPPKRRAQMIEKWDDDTKKLIELAVKFMDTDEPVTRSEFLPPIAQLIDGGVYEELWELDDMRQRMKEVQCHWCNLLTPKEFNDCQACDKPLEQNVR